MTNIKQRILTAIIIIPISVLILLYSNTFVFYFILELLIFIAIIEFLRMLSSKGISYMITPIILSAVFLPLAVAREDFFLLIFTLLFVSLLSFILKLFSTNPLQSIFTCIGATFVTIIYIPLLLSLMFPLQIKYTNYLIFTLFVIWASDSAALFFGKFFGKRSLYKIISPKKTVEGLIASYFGGFLVAIIYNTFFTITKELDFYIITFTIITAGAIGDLVESMFKRGCHIKDSGRVIPGHGGLLDKIDSLLFALPVLYLYIFFKT